MHTIKYDLIYGIHNDEKNDGPNLFLEIMPRIMSFYASEPWFTMWGLGTPSGPRSLTRWSAIV